ncbi:hypothetical protein [Arthrobacter antioxidans]|uniref:hypothetical protein n=1 Tax=Arthrobacter antioxidans TaxID=2895818 RepID=UPI001FFF7C5F|nr:hypothetical protein [Arthrobacter antioxidans]
MSTQCPPASTPTDEATPYRSALLVASGARDVRGGDTLFHRLTAETDALLEHLEGTVARLALAHRASAPDTETRLTDDDAFVWVQQSIEDIAATLRGLVLERSTEHPAETPLHACTDRA